MIEPRVVPQAASERADRLPPHSLPRLLAASLAALALASCAKGGAGGRGFAMPPTPVETSEARAHSVSDEFRALGTIESDDIIQVVSELNATVVELPFREGQPVAQGALLAKLDDREARAEADRAEAEAEKARSEFERAKSLSEQKLIPQQQLDDAGTALKVAQANASLAHTRLEKTRIRAPFAGLVGRRRVSPGAYLRSGDVITDLARVDEMKVTFSAPERFAGELKPGIGLRVTTPAYPGRDFAGHVGVVNPIVNAESRTVELVAHIPNPRRELRPGMSANVTVTLAVRGNALTVPDEAVFAEGNQNFVFVVKPDSTVTKTVIELGTRDSAAVEIKHGLSPGALVVRAGHQKLYEGAKVMPVSAAAGPGAAAPAAATGRAK